MKSWQRALLVSPVAARLDTELTVRDAPVVNGLAGDRLCLAAPKVQAPAANDAQWRPSMQSSLSTQWARDQRGGADSITLGSGRDRSNAR